MFFIEALLSINLKNIKIFALLIVFNWIQRDMLKQKTSLDINNNFCRCNNNKT